MGLSDTWPIPLDHITQYIAFLSCIGFSPSSAKCHVSGLNFYSKLQNFDDFANSFVVRKMLEGMKRTKSRGTDTRLPITYELLSKIVGILPNICSSSYESKLFAAAFSIAFFGFLRVGEITHSKSNGVFNHTIGIEDVQVFDSSIQLHIASSKTDQYGSGVKLLISEQADNSVCPVFHLKHFLGVRPCLAGPLFCHFGGKPVTRYQFSSLLKKAVTTLGVSQARYGTHSFRIGCATYSAMKGFSDEKIKLMGRRKSPAFKTYIRVPCL